MDGRDDRGANANIHRGEVLQAQTWDQHKSIQDYAARHPNFPFLISSNGDVYYPTNADRGDVANLKRFLLQQQLPISNPGGRDWLTVFEDVFHSYMDALRAEEARGESPVQTPIELISTAIKLGASDIHYEARKGIARSRVRCRVHGEMRTMADGIGFDAAAQAIRTFFTGKELGRSGFSEHDSNDGSFDYRHHDRIYNVRLNCIPSVEGMKMVCRIRDPKAVHDITRSGYSRRQLSLIRRTMRLTEGMFLICGPTNSGKSTTVTSLLHDEPSTRIIIELADPVEAVLENVTHVNMAPRGEDAEDKRARLIEATVRQDTDILCLGEVRNKVTADAAEQLAEQGKLVISTLHTASVTGVHSRLEGIGMGMHLLATPSFFRAAVAQRLVPTLCPHCSTPLPTLKPHERHRIGDHIRIRLIARHYQMHRPSRAPSTPVRLRYRATDGKCKKCSGTGILGRTLVAEAMEVDGMVREIYASGDTSGLREYLLGTQGMESIHEHALGKMMTGLIDPISTEDRIEPVTPMSVLPDSERKVIADWHSQLLLPAIQASESDKHMQHYWALARRDAEAEAREDAARRSGSAGGKIEVAA